MKEGIKMNTIETVINNYFHAYMEADSEKLLKAFHAETRLYSVDEGKLEKTEMSDWVANLNTRKMKGGVRQGQLEILSVDTQSDSAVAKVKIKLPTMEFVDFLSLLKFEDNWKIVGKIYSVKST
jgi:hypothetical protein